MKRVAEYYEPRTWKEFGNNGFLWLVNTALQPFGWVIVFEQEGEEITSVYPARIRTKQSGFPPEATERGLQQIRKYMVEQGYTLFQEAQETLNDKTKNNSC